MITIPATIITDTAATYYHCTTTINYILALTPPTLTLSPRRSRTAGPTR